MSGLTVETAAGVSAFVEQLLNASRGGSPVDEETLALRMLASANGGEGFDSSHIKSLFGSDGGDRVAMDATAPPRDKFDEFADLMMSDLKPVKEVVASGGVPKPPPVVIEDVIVGDHAAGFDKADAIKNFSYLKDAQSVCQMFINIMLIKIRPGGFNITSEAAEAFKVQAQLGYNAMAGPMAGVYNFSEGVKQSHTFVIPRSQVHEKLLGTMFDGMKLDAGQKAMIDSEITNFVKGLQNIQIDGAHSTVDFALRFGMTPVKNITGDAANPISVYEPMTYLIYLTMDAGAWSRAVSKNSSEEMITMKYEHVVTKFELNVDRFLQQRPKYDKMFETATGMSLKKYGDLLNKSVKK